MLKTLKISLLIALFMFLVSASSCEKDKNEPAIVNLEYNSIRFRLIIEEDFDSIGGMVLITKVFRSDSNITHITTTNYNVVNEKLTDTLLSSNDQFRDSIVFDSVRLRYQVEFNALYKNLDHPKNDCRNNYYWKLDAQDVTSLSDTLITIFFPRDTIKGRQYNWVTEEPIEDVCGE